MGGNEPKETSDQDEDDYWLVSQQAEAFRDGGKNAKFVHVWKSSFWPLEEFSSYFQDTADTSTDILKEAQRIEY